MALFLRMFIGHNQCTGDRLEWLSSDWTHRHFSALLTMIDYSFDTELHGRLGVAVSRFFFAFVEDHKDIEHGALILTARQTNL